MPFVKLHTVKTEELINEVFPNRESLGARLSASRSVVTQPRCLSRHSHPWASAALLVTARSTKLRAHCAAWLASGQKHHIEHTNPPRWATSAASKYITSCVGLSGVSSSLQLQAYRLKNIRTGSLHLLHLLQVQHKLNQSVCSFSEMGLLLPSRQYKISITIQMTQLISSDFKNTTQRVVLYHQCKNLSGKAFCSSCL